MSTPKLTVALVVSREGACLQECLSSVLGQSFRDFEVIAVDNASPDHGAEMLEEFREGDPRLVVCRLDHAVSRGEASNLALESASGEYIWFVETTDLLPAGALAVAAARLEETSPDVLVVGHAPTGSRGVFSRRPHQAVMAAAAESGTFALVDHPEVASSAPRVWDKIFRREFLRTSGLRFARGGFAELTLTYRALLAAKRISTLDRACYLRREPAEARSDLRRWGDDARQVGGKAARVGRRKAHHVYYRSQRTKPIDPDLTVFAAYWYGGYLCNPRAIYEKLRELAPSMRSVWVVDEDRVESMPPGVEYVLSWTKDYYRLLAGAKYFVNNVNFPNDLVKREGTIHVQTHHGTPMKTMGLDQRGAFVAGRTKDFDKLLRRCERWDYSITSNRFSTLTWQRAYPTWYETLEVGYPRNDVLVDASDADVARIRQELGIAPEQRALLYAPTHREYLPGYVPTFDVERLAGELGPDYVIMARAHYFYGEDANLHELHDAGRILDVTRHHSVEEVCLAADVLVTDYSAIMFDYAVLDRPIVIHAPDWDVYRALRGTYFDLVAEPPGVVTTTDDQLVAAFRSGAVSGDDAAALRATFRAEFCTLDDGQAAERVVRRVWLPESELETESVRTAGRPRPARMKA